ncbi:hypothetical protein SAMN05216483_6664 [Streptomyces sp. 2131.1]|uniref:hypothetical protein n=1 Tax=Streptomyces sp. 2131.1 TaxID=1855346 RepID=UPI0008994528|nr:hypothetical protein [Streptomyces sp. 2131.1]SEE82412.1 hypothetical protein SAMN05216483_6664 [Streptomyces sp. 2131.1]
MRRQRQCTTWSCFAVDVQCQRLAKHEGPHGASPTPTYDRHWSWTDEDPDVIEVLPGTVWFHRPKRAPRGKTARAVAWWVALDGPIAFLLWLYSSPVSAVVFVALELLIRVRRPRFVDLGRFTAGVWPVTPAAPPLLFGVAWATHGEGRNAKIAGLEVILGPVVVGAFSLVPRSEWPAYKRSQAAFKALRKERR